MAKSCLMSAIADMNEPYAHRRCASDERLIFSNITCCYGKQMTVFAVAIAAGDSVNYQSFVYGSFVWEMHVRYNNKITDQSAKHLLITYS